MMGFAAEVNMAGTWFYCALALLSACSWAVGAVLWRKLGEHLSSYAMNLAKTALGSLFLGAFLLLAGMEPISARDLLYLALSGIVGIAIGDTFFFLALMELGPRRASLIGSLNPVAIAVTAVLLLGGVSAVLGVLYALMQHDLKRLLAYHTVENIGIIFIGLGLALAFRANDMGTAAALALTAALFHVFNHSLFKSLLFLGAGAVLHATGERDMEHLGGLIRRMPQTAIAFLAGSTAIAALPPFNGFVSEWLTFQAILLSPRLPQWLLKFMVPAVGAMLALSAALAAGCFVKAFGATFLGRPRSAAAVRAHEVDRLSLAAMFLLAGLCFAAGVLPGFFIDALAPVTQLLAHARLAPQQELKWLTIVPIAEGRSSYNGLLLFVLIAGAAWLGVWVIHRWASHALRRSAAWDCGFPDPRPVTQYTAGSFAQPIRRVFGSLAFRAHEHVSMPPPGQMKPARMRVSMHDLVWDALYAPIQGLLDRATGRLDRVQSWTIRAYLTMVFGSVVLLLMVLTVWH